MSPAQIKQNGFTIVELLIVIVVIAILATISLVVYNGVQKRAKNSQIQAAVVSYAKSLKLYAVDNGALPNIAQSGGSYACLGNYSDGICANASINVNPTFDNLLVPYRGNSNHPELPAEYMYTNNGNNWWRGVWYVAGSSQLNFVQYQTGSCPVISGTTFVSASPASGDIICRVSIG
jgi:prepilin-type N-terminal cleavage/methylation domain-containing protein